MDDIFPPDERRALAEGGHDGCGYDHFGGAVLLGAPMVSLLIGSLVAHLSSRMLPSLPYTPALALIGIIVACVAMHQDACAHMRGSVEKWIQVDGHAMLFIFLPPLLFSDTMHMDWNLAKVSLMQCLLLASTGVLAGALLHAIYGAFMLPYGWSFTLALGFGAVQAATDPVAVVSLLSSLGAPQTLTMIISGESLLNDGTAIVVWNVAFYSYLGEGRNAAIYSVQLIFGGLVVGLVFWAFLLYWMSLLNRKHGHTDTVVQVGLTVFGSYSCFYVAEAVCGVSGVLAVVTMGVGLSATFWPLVCSRDTMEHVWHIYEWILNTFLFQLAGLIIGARLVVPMLFGESATTVHVAAVEGSEHAAALTGGDVGLACLTWLVGVIIRAIVIGSHFPALQKLGYGMTKEDAMTCWWGGLHGGVGLALAMSMEHELREAGQPEQGARILLHVSVAAMLTLLVNAPTMAPMLKKFGLTSTSPAKQQKYAELRARVNAYAWAEFSKLIEQGKLAPQSKRWQDAVPSVIHVMTNEQRRASLTGHVNALEQSVLRSPPTEATQEIGKANDLERLYETRRAFLGLVRNAYTNYLEEGVIPARSTLAVHLIASIHYANDHIDEPLADWTELAKLALEIPAGTRYTLKVLKPLWGIKKLKIWLVENGPETYAENVAFALTAFIGAHENAQDQIKWMFGSKSDSLNAEQSLVCSESAQSIYKAKLFLHELHKVVVGEHLEAEDDVIDYVKARQISAVLLHRLAIFVEKLQKNGVLEDWMTEHLLHEIEHDEVMLRSHLKKLAAKAGVDEDTRLTESLAQVDRLHEQYLALMEKEGIDVTKKTLKERIAIEREAFKQKKHLPGQKTHMTDIETVEVATPRAVPPPAPGGDAASEALPPGWSTAKDDNGRVYYLNNATGASQWTPPTA